MEGKTITEHIAIYSTVATGTFVGWHLGEVIEIWETGAKNDKGQENNRWLKVLNTVKYYTYIQDSKLLGGLTVGILSTIIMFFVTKKLN